MLNSKILNDYLNEIDSIVESISVLRTEYKYFKDNIELANSIKNKIIKLTKRKRDLEKELKEIEKIVYDI